MKATDLDSAIRDIISSRRISDQKSLLQGLESLGFQFNQSTLSRHLKKLNILKKDGYYQSVPVRKPLSGGPVHSLVRGVKQAPPNLIFIQALPGHAAAVGYYLDKLEIGNIVGTVAGDDTLLVAITPPSALESVLEEIQKGLGLSGP